MVNQRLIILFITLLLGSYESSLWGQGFIDLCLKEEDQHITYQNMFREFREKFGPSCEAIYKSLREGNSIQIRNAIPSIGVLKDFSHIQTLELANGAFKLDFAELHFFPKLTSFLIDHSNGYENVASLSSLKNRLRELSITLYRKREGDFSFLKDLRGLRKLQIKGIKDLAPLAYLSNLKSLELEGMQYSMFQITNLAPLSDLISLEELTLVGVSAESIMPLMSLGNLRSLKLKQVPHLKNLKAVQFLENLSHFSYHCAGWSAYNFCEALF